MQIETYEGEHGNWYWEFVTRGRVSAPAATPFLSEANALRSAKSVVRGVLDLFPGQPVHFVASRSKDGKRTVLRWSHQ